jgi:hypothetical protein
MEVNWMNVLKKPLSRQISALDLQPGIDSKVIALRKMVETWS